MFLDIGRQTDRKREGKGENDIITKNYFAYSVY